ncbi:peptide/nickel transport system ATP-binding protein [Conyzicola lurida]|uniref:Peptide/nickel transport system ATP-binding protein n=1 Tax=Conyzicola lurida TaxID=1172621 RepID=A0A841AJL3_9MICO|nr:ABC transporter ATP-binding protein [Conyzicola lurida]MBB5842162.1 peptide/nickel transport system ATP-binding protein [Conyzicola lurida]
MTAPALQIDNLSIGYGAALAVDGVSITVQPGEIVGVIGESGSGKSTIAMAALGLLPSYAEVSADRFDIDGVSTIGLDETAWSQIRGMDASMIFQEPMSALNPSMTVGAQIAEALTIHGVTAKNDARAKTFELLNLVHMPSPEVRMRQYPFQLSGGQRQRVMIAMAMAASPKLLVADEPTTALDVTVQAQILDLIVELRNRTDMGVLIISHDLGVIGQLCDRVFVMYRGRVVESGVTQQVLTAPQHPYTVALLESVLAGQQAPRTMLPTIRADILDADPAATVDDVIEVHEAPVVAAARPEPRADDVIVRFDSIVKDFTTRGNVIRAVDDVSLEIRRGETFGVVGESGSGKSTLSRIGTLIERPTSGTITFDGIDVTHASGRALRQFRSKIQVVFQDPNDSLDPRYSVFRSVAEPLRTLKLSRDETYERVIASLESVGLSGDTARRLPHEFSGGQRQRIAIARAMVTNPEFVVLDEATSALDVSVQAQILNLLLELQERTGVTYLFISHNLAVVRHLAQRMAVMRGGKIVEVGDSEAVFTDPQDEYTQRLLESIPKLAAV